MATTTSLLTYDVYGTLPDGTRYELVRGELFEMPPPSRRHQWLPRKLSMTLNGFIG